jgi:atypical dual specificity phosphatase
MDFDQILPQLFVGSCPIDPADIDLLKSHFGITAVLNLQTEEDFTYWGINWQEVEAAYHRSGIELRRVPVQDFNREDLRQRLPACVQALDELLRSGHTVYLHCTGGVNRSPSTAVAYLHWVQGMGFDEAANYVKERRACDPCVEAIRLATEDRAAGK